MVFENIKLLYSLDQYGDSVVGEYNNEKFLFSIIYGSGHDREIVIKKQWIFLLMKLRKFMNFVDYNQFRYFLRKNYGNEIYTSRRKKYAIFKLTDDLIKIFDSNNENYKTYIGMSLNYYYDKNGKIKQYEKNQEELNNMNGLFNIGINENYWKNVKIWNSDDIEQIGNISYSKLFKKNKNFIEKL